MYISILSLPHEIGLNCMQKHPSSSSSYSSSVIRCSSHSFCFNFFLFSIFYLLFLFIFHYYFSSLILYPLIPSSTPSYFFPLHHLMFFQSIFLFVRLHELTTPIPCSSCQHCRSLVIPAFIPIMWPCLRRKMSTFLWCVCGCVCEVPVHLSVTSIM